jgi:hypothetical protein
MRYTIKFSDGIKKDCLTSDGAIRVIAFRQRVTPADLITDTTEERILVRLYRGENTVAEVIAALSKATPGLTLKSRLNRRFGQS